MEVSALKYSGQIGLHGRSPLLRLQSDERLIALLRRGNTAAFEMLVSRYEARLQAFGRRLQRDPGRRAADQRAALAVPDRAQPQPQPPAAHPGDRCGLDGPPFVRA